MSSIALFPLPHNWTIPFQRFFLQFCIFTQRLACARALAWRPVQANTLHCVAFHIRANAFCFVANALISFLAYMLLHFLENTFCQPTLGSRLVERNDYSEMLLNSSRASEATFLCNLCGWQRAVWCRWQAQPSAGLMTGNFDNRTNLHGKAFWQIRTILHSLPWQILTTLTMDLILKSSDKFHARLRLSATFSSLAPLFVYLVKWYYQLLLGWYFNMREDISTWNI